MTDYLEEMRNELEDAALYERLAVFEKLSPEDREKAMMAFANDFLSEEW